VRPRLAHVGLHLAQTRADALVLVGVAARQAQRELQLLDGGVGLSGGEIGLGLGPMRLGREAGRLGDPGVEPIEGGIVGAGTQEGKEAAACLVRAGGGKERAGPCPEQEGIAGIDGERLLDDGEGAGGLAGGQVGLGKRQPVGDAVGILADEPAERRDRRPRPSP